LKISKRTVDAMQIGDTLNDEEIKGFIARRLKSGVISYGLRYRVKGSWVQRLFALGTHGNVTPDQARTLAKRAAGEVAAGRDPQADRQAERAVATNTVDSVLDAFLTRYVRNPDRPLRSADEIERTFRVYVRPKIGKRSIYDLSRRDIVDMLDKIEDENGPVMCDRVLAYTRKAFRWQMARDDDFTSPIVPGMARTRPKERARRRTLDDQEIRDLWAALGKLDNAKTPFPRLVKVLLLMALRREEAAAMSWSEIDEVCYAIPEDRAKNYEENALPLTESVRALLGKPGKGFVFTTTDGARPFSGFSKAKAALDRTITELRKQAGRSPMPPYMLKDLRRTARSLMSRAGVSSDHAERVLSHTIPGVRGVYDRHSYLAEKRDAIEKLAALVELILNPSDAVVPFVHKQS
jgi:integrase